MHQIVFPEKDLDSIRYERFHHPDPRVAQRVEILWLKQAGIAHAEIARLASVSRSTVQRTFNIYREQGLDGIRQFHEQGPRSPLSEHAKLLTEEFRIHPPKSVADAARQIERLTGIGRKSTQVRYFLRNTLGLQWRKVAAVPLPPNKTLEQHAQIQGNFLK